MTDPTNDTAVSGDEGDVVTFSCTARGVPVPSITWSNAASDGITINITSPMEDSEGYISITSTLTISGVMRDDNGSYACNATNTIMDSVEMETRTFTLAVNCKFVVCVSNSYAIVEPCHPNNFSGPTIP